jgi:hypothetical protein
MFINQYMYQEVCDLLLESREHCERLINENNKLKKQLNDVTFIKIKKNNDRYAGMPIKAMVVRAFKRLDNSFVVEGHELVDKGANTRCFEDDYLYPFAEEEVKCLL